MNTVGPVPVTTLSPLAAGTLVWRMGGVTRITVIAKATFEIVPGEAAREAAPLPLSTEDRARPAGPELEEASEVAPYLPRAGVVLRGSVHGRGGPHAPVVVSLGLFRYQWLIKKRLMRRPDAAGSPGLTGLVDPERPDRAAGFGAISPLWSPRREAAPRGVVWSQPVVDLPKGTDFRYFIGAPADQQCAFIEGDEWIALEGVHPTLDLIRTRLPSVQMMGNVGLPRSSAGPAQDVPVRMLGDTLTIDADRMMFSVVSRGVVELTPDQIPQSLAITVGLALPNRPVVFPSAPVKVRKAVLEGTAGVNEIEVARMRERGGVPFVGSKAKAQAQLAGTIDLKGPAAAAVAPFPIAKAGGREAFNKTIPGAPFLRPPKPGTQPAAPTADEDPPVVAPPPEVIAPAPPEVIAPPPPPAPPEPAETGLRAIVLKRAKASASMADLDLAGADLHNLDLRGASFERQNLQGVTLAGCKLAGARFASANLGGADLSGADATGADFTGADLTRATIAGTLFDGAKLVGAIVASSRGAGARFDGADLERADLRAARLADSSFKKARLRGVLGARADLSGCTLLRADLTEASLRGARMARAVLAFANVKEADLRDVNLEGANLHGVDRAEAKLGAANLKNVVDTPPPGAEDMT